MTYETILAPQKDTTLAPHKGAPHKEAGTGARQVERGLGALTVGLGGASRHSCAALAVGPRLLGVCEQERATRVRAAGPNASGLPDEAMDLLLERHGLHRGDIQRVASAERFHGLAAADADARMDHHLAHAAASYLTSPTDGAVVTVLDHEPPGVSVWMGRGAELAPVEWPWRGDGLATVYSACANALGFAGSGHGQHLEALARLMPDARDARIDGLFALGTDSIRTTAGWQGEIEERSRGLVLESSELQALASAVQARLGDLLLEILSAIRRATGATRVCLAGSLFYNSYFCGLVKRSQLFDEVFVPMNPGDAGLSVGTALYAARATPRAISPFLGPAFAADEIKATLDNCKLQYDWLGEIETIERAVSALERGYLVGWFDGAMEWGPRALGGRSILANPFSPYVLENLNRFLKHRPSWRRYALSGLDADVHRLFDGPEASPYMECDYKARDHERFRHVLPDARAAIRIQTVGAGAPPRFRALLRAFGEKTGAAVLINTSFNGFSEPIVCRPRDAVRVFYGTGLDLLVLDRFVLAK